LVVYADAKGFPPAVVTLYFSAVAGALMGDFIGLVYY